MIAIRAEMPLNIADCPARPFKIQVVNTIFVGAVYKVKLSQIADVKELAVSAASAMLVFMF